MLFRIVDHYELDSNMLIKCKNKEDKNDCFICFENENKLLKLKTQKFYKKKCYCDGWIHEHCLHKWFDSCNECPICRKNMIKLEKSEKLFLLFYVFIFIQKYIGLYIKCISFMYFIYSILNNYNILIKYNSFQKNYSDDYCLQNFNETAEF
jgi:hypothetical protein